MARYKYSILADANISGDMVEDLRNRCLTVEWVNDLPIKHKGDDLILKEANRRKMFLLTNNYKDFFDNDNEFHFHSLTGIIAITKNICFCSDIARLLRHKKENITGKKYKYTQENIIIKLGDGRIINETHKFDIDDCPCIFKNSIHNW